MTNPPQDKQLQLTDAAIQEKLRSLLHKEGTWIDWGKTCQELHQAGCEPSQIFEATGFQASQQNLVIVAAQVYDSVVARAVPELVLRYFQGPKSDVLYEFRILNQTQRAAAAQLAYDKQSDVYEAHEIAKAIKDVSRLSQLPTGFTNHPGDMVAYLCWKRARQKKDLQERSRLIAKGLKFAASSTAREVIEKLLSDFTVVPQKTAPLLPIYRLEVEEELPRIIPLVVTSPVTSAAIEAVARVQIQEPFRSVKLSTGGNFVPVPGWQLMLKASDPVGYVSSSDRLPQFLSGRVEPVLIIIDRAVKEWDVNSYFLVETANEPELQWFETPPEAKIIGQLVLIMRPKKILDEGNITQPWQMDD
ncbi:MAG TPA: RuBisCO accumulation factor 1 [Xenococcaceae cyanobacterium]